MIKRDLKNMKKRRAAICFLMVFIMSFTLLPSGVFAAQQLSQRKILQHIVLLVIMLMQEEALQQPNHLSINQ